MIDALAQAIGSLTHGVSKLLTPGHHIVMHSVPGLCSTGRDVILCYD